MAIPGSGNKERFRDRGVKELFVKYADKALECARVTLNRRCDRRGGLVGHIQGGTPIVFPRRIGVTVR